MGALGDLAFREILPWSRCTRSADGVPLASGGSTRFVPWPVSAGRSVTLVSGLNERRAVGREGLRCRTPLLPAMGPPRGSGKVTSAGSSTRLPVLATAPTSELTVRLVELVRLIRLPGAPMLAARRGLLPVQHAHSSGSQGPCA